MKRRPSIVPLEERIVLDAAAAAVVADTVATMATAAKTAVSDAVAKIQASHLDSHATHTDTTASNIIYVNGSATGTQHDGTSWNRAYVSLQSALDKAAQTPGSDQIWIAQGTYTPSKIYAPTDANGNPIAGGAAALDPNVINLDLNSMKTFNIPDKVQLYGGFAGGEISLGQRDPLHHTTILSGGGTDWHVVMMGNDITQTGVNAKLDGLTISDGYASGPDLPFGGYQYNHSFGAGAYIANSTVTINNVIFKNNFAWGDGGGLYTNNTDILITKSQFLSNTAVVRGGGYEALNTYENVGTTNTPHTATVHDTLFKDNTSWTFGGAIVGEGTFASHDSALNITKSTFINNNAAEGGAVVVDSLNVNVTDSTFTGNHATVAAGALATTSIVNSLFGGPNDFITKVSDSTFINNVADGDITAHSNLNGLFTGFIPGFVINFSRGGGALVSYMTGRLVVDDSTFINNVAKSGDGGAILNGGADSSFYGVPFHARADTIVTDSIFINNRALDGSGGAIASDSTIGLQTPGSLLAVTSTIKSNVFINNDASKNGGAINLTSSYSTIKSNLLFGSNDADGLGDQIYGNNSYVNGISTGSLLAKWKLVTTNVFLLLNNDDIILS